jgi:transcriptional regulator with XRE-family HTH domain
MPRPKYRDRQLQAQIARRVRQARLHKGWTQEQLAEALDVASETVSRYESGRVPLSVTMLYRVADVLDIKIESLVGKGPAGLSRTETELVEGWRSLDGEGQQLVMLLVRWGSRGGDRPKSAARTAIHEKPSHTPSR